MGENVTISCISTKHVMEIFKKISLFLGIFGCIAAFVLANERYSSKKNEISFFRNSTKVPKILIQKLNKPKILLSIYKENNSKFLETIRLGDFFSCEIYTTYVVFVISSNCLSIF